ncbi:MAG: hypothetical protein V1820_06550 [archaeon]
MLGTTSGATVNVPEATLKCPPRPPLVDRLVEYTLAERALLTEISREVSGPSSYLTKKLEDVRLWGSATGSAESLIEQVRDGLSIWGPKYGFSENELPQIVMKTELADRLLIRPVFEAALLDDLSGNLGLTESAPPVELSLVGDGMTEILRLPKDYADLMLSKKTGPKETFATVSDKRVPWKYVPVSDELSEWLAERGTSEIAIAFEEAYPFLSERQRTKLHGISYIFLSKGVNCSAPYHRDYPSPNAILFGCDRKGRTSPRIAETLLHEGDHLDYWRHFPFDFRTLFLDEVRAISETTDLLSRWGADGSEALADAEANLEIYFDFLRTGNLVSLMRTHVYEAFEQTTKDAYLSTPGNLTARISRNSLAQAFLPVTSKSDAREDASRLPVPYFEPSE